jgi:diguanylate cyclase (GGDEF)-like protein
VRRRRRLTTTCEGEDYDESDAHALGTCAARTSAAWTLITWESSDVPENTRALGVTVASLTVVLLIGWLDHATGPDIGFSLFYLLPIAASAWFGGRGSTIVVAFVAAASWLAADLGWRVRSDTALAISFWNAFTRLVIFASEGMFIAVLKEDREKLRRLAEREYVLARTDATTGLPNTRAFLERGALELLRGVPLATLYIDLDNFKVFNDRLGHAAGDDILMEVARVLRESVEEDDFAARIGGDEFAVLLCSGADDLRARRVSETIADRISGLAAAYGDMGFGATIGVALFHEPPQTAELLLRSADEAMYRGKVQGKGRVVVQNE